EVGSRYESGEFFLPRLLRSAESAKRAFAAVNAALEKRGDASVSKGRIVVATVRGDIHDIGKNIVKTVLQNYGYEVLDLGRDVSPERVAQAALKFGAGLVGLSALMTTTLPSMSETISALRRNLPHCKTMVGGAVVTEEYACSIGADYYARDAKMATDIAKKVFQNS
ncbi:MAG: cobalamin-dependent protein, partial [Oscillospiraceae bacterium]